MPLLPPSALHRYFIIPQSIKKRMATHPLCRALYLNELGFEGETTFCPFPKSTTENQYVLVYIVKGEGWYKVNKKTYPVSSHDYFVLPVNRIGQLGVSKEKPWSIYWAFFSGEQAPQMCDHLMGNSLSPQKAKPLMGRIEQFNDILHHLELMENTENLIYANSRFYTFLCSFRLSVLSSVNHAKKDRVIQSIGYMRKNIFGKTTLVKLAEVAGLSVSHYCAAFKEKTTQTPMQFYTSMKIQRACQLLHDPTKTIKTIAYSLGFFDPYHFSKVFKSVMGDSPKTYRNKTTMSR